MRGTRNGARRQGNREGGGMASSFPFFSFFISNRGSTRCPISLLFEQGQRMLPPCLFISFRMGAVLAAPVSFHFFSNGGSKCCPRVFSFRFERTGGQHVRFTLPPFLSVSIGGSVYPHAAPFLSVSNGGSVYRTCCPPVSFGFNQGQHETHMPPLFRVLYPPITGGI